MQKVTILCCCLAVSVIPISYEYWRETNRQLTEWEMESAKGLDFGFPCGSCEEKDEELCEGPFSGGINNDCEWQGCITLVNDQDDTTCGLATGNRKYTGDTIIRLDFDPTGEPLFEENLDTGSTHLCDYGIVCQNDTTWLPGNICFKNPNAAGFCTPDPTAPIGSGCRTCAAGGQTDPLSHHSLEDHECAVCADPTP